MIWVGGLVTSLNPLQESAQLGLVMAPLLNHAGLLQETEAEQGQAGSGGCRSKPKNVKLPVTVSILSINHASEEAFQSKMLG